MLAAGQVKARRDLSTKPGDALIRRLSGECSRRPGSSILRGHQLVEVVPKLHLDRFHYISRGGRPLLRASPAASFRDRLCVVGLKSSLLVFGRFMEEQPHRGRGGVFPIDSPIKGEILFFKVLQE